MGQLLSKMAQDFLVAFGVVLGAALMTGIHSVLTLQSPSLDMLKIASRVKIWAVVVAIGGSIDPFRVIETNFLNGYMSPAIKQIVLMISAFIGAHLGTELIRWISGGGGQA
jgi:uncharacterized membrane protein